MKRIVLAVVCIMSLALSARAEPKETAPPADADLQRVVMEELVTPWRARERSFSRVRRPAPEMRVRIVDRALRHDAQGEAFVWFEVDSRRAGKAWHSGMMRGCLYPNSRTIYLAEGDSLRHAPSLLGQEDDRAVPATACRDAG